MSELIPRNKEFFFLKRNRINIGCCLNCLKIPGLGVSFNLSFRFMKFSNHAYDIVKKAFVN
jgi:hypothetical protein